MKEDLHNSCECWFLDVGQGTSNVILLGEGKAIVIDCGPKSSTETLRLLERYVKTIEALIISHNDKDHDGNVGRILNHYRNAINAIYFLKDRTPSANIATFALLKSPEFKYDFPSPQMLVANQTVWQDNNFDLTVLYPSFMANLEHENCPNMTSGILRLKCGKHKIVYSGDAGIKAWESLSQQFGQRPLICDVMTIPHHGGKIASTNRLLDHQKLYTDFVRPKMSIISTGSSNRDRHPLPETISALRELGIEVFCTQMTTQCCRELESIRQVPRVIPQPSRSSINISSTQSGKSRNVACFGSVVLEVSETAIKISDLSAFTRAYRGFSHINAFNPMCNRDASI